MQAMHICQIPNLDEDAVYGFPWPKFQLESSVSSGAVREFIAANDALRAPTSYRGGSNVQ
jgi:hypothetical protein